MSQEISKVPTYLTPCDEWDHHAQSNTPDYQFLGEFIKTHAEGEKIHGTALAYALYLGQFYWPKSPPEIGKPFGYDYDTWACWWSGKRDVGPYIRVGELLYQFRYNILSLPENVVLRDAEGEEVKEEETLVVVQPDVFSPDVNYTKLLLSKRKAQETGLTDEDWGLLLNPDVTVEQYRQHLLGGEGYGWDSDPGGFRCWQEGPMILCSEGGRTVEYITIDGLNEDGLLDRHPILIKAHSKVCKALGMKNRFGGDF